MDKEKLRKALEEIVGDMISKKLTGDESAISQMVHKAVETSLEEVQAKLADVPRPGATEARSSTSLVLGALPASQLSGNLVQTRQGSILDLSRKSTPWVQCSPEMEKWALAFGEYLSSKGKVVSKLLQESDDPSGGYELVLMGYGACQKGH
jgi:hypothetical protein